VNILEAALRRIATDLERHGRRWALVGGFAVSARAEPRFTRDIDAAVVVDDDADGEHLVRLLLADRYRVLASVEQDETGRLATVRLSSPLSGGDVVVDLLFASSGIEPEIVAAAETTEVVPGLRLPIATTGHLIALKLLARDDLERPQDLADSTRQIARQPCLCTLLLASPTTCSQRCASIAAGFGRAGRSAGIGMRKRRAWDCRRHACPG